MEAFIYTTSNNFCKLFSDKKSYELITNIHSEIFSININGYGFVCCRNIGTQNSYVCSLTSGYVRYALDELKSENAGFFKYFAKITLNLLSVCFKAANIEKMIFLNNTLFSTSFFGKDFNFQSNEPQNTLSITGHKEFFAIRNLNEQYNKEIIDTLQKSDWLIVPSRVVYIFKASDLEQRKRKNHYKRDMTLLQKTSLKEQAKDFSMQDFCVMQKLFEKLYIEKHSHENPKYSAEFIKRCFENQILEIYAFKNQNEIVAFIGIFQMHDIISTPMLGYDTSLPKELGLYRLLCAKLHLLAEARGMDINFSSGAGEFKKARGGIATLEYTAIYCKHLPFYKSFIIKFFSYVLNKAKGSFFRLLDK